MRSAACQKQLRDKLLRTRPETLAAAARIQGMTPAALAAIAAYLRKRAAVRADAA